MTGEVEKEVRHDQKGNVLLVGLKLDNTGRELLTWILAKFTHVGDHVIALHVAPSISQADTLKSKLDSTEEQAEGSFDSIIGVYESFCSIKQVDLEVKVTDGHSLRRALIEEARKSNAAKLILGHVSSRPHIGSSSFSLAKYCTKRLPTTCSIMVIQNGQVVFMKEGRQRNIGTNSHVLNTLHRTLRSHSWNNSGHHNTHGRREIALGQSCEIGVVHGEYGSTPCPWPLPTRFLDSPVSVLQAYKCSSMQKRALGPLASPVSTLSSPTDSTMAQSQCGSNPSCHNEVHKEASYSHKSLEDFFIQTDGDNPYAQGWSVSDKVNRSQSTQGTSSNSDEDKDVELCTHKLSLEMPTDGTYSEETSAEGGSPPPSVGWPLLRKHFTPSQEHHKVITRRMSVVEWALQLPDRPKEIFNHQIELSIKDNSSPSSYYSSESRNHVQGLEENTMVCESGVLPQCPTESVVTRIARLSKVRPCKQFHIEELQAATSNFISDNMVGRGGCSQVYQGVLADAYEVAVKCLNAAAIDSDDEFVTEVEIMCSLHHDHIVQLIGYCVESQHYMLVYNFASEGNLEQKLHGGKGKAVFTWESRYNIAIGVADALRYLHDCCAQPVIHRDVKSSNILLASDLEPQLTDFGLAKWMPPSSTQITCSDVVGTFGYLAPEYFMFGKVSEKTDVYSFGVVLLELLTGRRPIDNTRPKGEENLVVWARPLLENELNAVKILDPKLEESYDAGQLKNIMVAAALCLRQSPQMRPRMSRILKLIRGEVEDLDNIGRQDSVCKESDDGCEMPNYGEIDIRTHLSLALLGLDDDAASQASIDHSVNLAHSNKYLEEYLGGRYSRSSSLE